MQGISPTNTTAQSINDLGYANFQIVNYIASVTNLPTSIPLANGEDAYAVLGLASRMQDLFNRCNNYIDPTSGVSPRLLTMAENNIPDCNTKFQAFAAQARTLSPNQELTGAVKTNMLNAINTFKASVDTLGATIQGASTAFSSFQNGVEADNETITTLCNDIGVNGAVSSTVAISADDKAMIQDAVESSAPNLQQDTGIALNHCAQMSASLLSLRDFFANISQKVSALQSDLSDANEFADVDDIVQASSDWNGFAQFVSKIRF